MTSTLDHPPGLGSAIALKDGGKAPSPARPDADQTKASFAVDLVVALGARTVFSLTGGMAMYLNRAVGSHPDLKAIYCQHEQACVAAAEGYAKAANFSAPGFAVVTAGPGVTNTITSLCSAYGDSAPVIVLAGQVKTADIDRFGSRTHGAQEVRSRELVSPAVKRFEQIGEEQPIQQLIDACAEAFTGRPGPVFIEIPLDVQNRPLAYDPQAVEAARMAVLARIAADADDRKTADLIEALHWIAAGEKPLIYVGNGCRIADIGKTVLDFATRAGVPLVNSWLTADLVGADHPLNFGAPGGLAPIWANRILYSADRVLFLGARLDLGTTAFQRDEFGAQAERWIVDVDPAELSKFSGLAAVRLIQANLKALPQAFSAWTASAQSLPDRSSWLATCQTLKATESAEEADRLKSDQFTVHSVAQTLSNWAGERVFVPTGSGAAIETFIRFFAPQSGSRCFFGASLGAMGLGLPQAVGAAFATERQVICVEGDGGLMLNLQELATVAHYAPAGFVLFILNNDGYLSIRASQVRHFGVTMGADQESGVFIPDYGAVCAAFGLDHHRIDSPSALAALLPGLGGTAKPQVIELMVARSEPRGPSAKTLIDENGKITSSSLADISW